MRRSKDLSRPRDRRVSQLVHDHRPRQPLQHAAVDRAARRMGRRLYRLSARPQPHRGAGPRAEEGWVTHVRELAGGSLRSTAAAGVSAPMCRVSRASLYLIAVASRPMCRNAKPWPATDTRGSSWPRSARPHQHHACASRQSSREGSIMAIALITSTSSHPHLPRHGSARFRTGSSTSCAIRLGGVLQRPVRPPGLTAVKEEHQAHGRKSPRSPGGGFFQRHGSLFTGSTVSAAAPLIIGSPIGDGQMMARVVRIKYWRERIHAAMLQ